MSQGRWGDKAARALTVGLFRIPHSPAAGSFPAHRPPDTSAVVAPERGIAHDVLVVFVEEVFNTGEDGRAKPEPIAEAQIPSSIAGIPADAQKAEVIIGARADKAYG